MSRKPIEVPLGCHYSPIVILAAGEKSGVMMAGKLTIRAAAAEGDAPKQPSFDLEAYNGGLMALQWWPHPVVVDGQGVAMAAQQIPAYVTHDETMENLVGQTRKVTVENGKITASGVLTANRESSEAYAQLVDHSANGYEFQCSIGASVQAYEFCDEGKQVIVNGQTFDGPCYVARKTTLAHIAIVPLGADTSTKASIAANHGQTSQQKGPNMTFEQWIVAQGFVLADLTPETKASLQAAYDGLHKAGALPPVKAAAPPTPPTPPAVTPPPSPEGDPIRASNAAHAANLRRIAALDQLQAKYSAVKDVAEICAKAIESNESPDAVELVLLRASRVPTSTAPAIIVNGGNVDSRVVEAALCLQTNAAPERTLLASYGQETMNRADAVRRMQFSQMAEIVARGEGRQLPMDRKSTEWLRAAFSGQALTGILGNVANKAMAAILAEPTWVAPRITGVASHANFHAHTIYSMAMNGELQEVAPSGELKHLDVSDESYTRQLKTRGAVLKLTRQDQINDELGVFVRNAQTMVRKAYLSREKALFTLFCATGLGASFFTAAHKNYFSGADSALDITSLGKGVKYFRDQTDAAGDPTGIEPRLLLVPSDLEDTARRITAPTGTLIVTGLSSTAAKGLDANTNIYAGRFEPVVSPFLSNSKLTGYSTTAWWLLADPNTCPVAEIAYLNGITQPTVEYFGVDSNADELAATWRIYWDFGVALAEYRAGVKSKGAA